jgi:hypothetical protein
LVNRDAFPWLGSNEDFMGSLGLFTTPRNPSHRANEAASTLGWRNFGELLWDFTIEGKLLEHGEAQVTKAEVPLHDLSLLVGGGKLGVLSLLQWG